MDIKKESITVNETIMRSNEKVLINSDVIVPDIKSDIAKILRIDADSIVESCNCVGGRLEIDGKIYITVIYVPDNDDKPVCSITADIPFETQIEDIRLANGVKAVCGADVYNVEFNLLNPRKVAVRTLVDLNVRALLPRTEDFVVSMDNTDCEVMCAKEKVFSLIDLKNSKFTAEETLDFPNAKSSAVSILKADVRLAEYQTHVITGKIIIKGSAESCLLYLSDEGKIEFINHEIPFTEVIDAPGVTDNSTCDLSLGVCVSSATLKADSDGDMRLLNIELLFSAELTAYEETEIELVSDCFSCTQNITCTQNKINMETLAYHGEIQKNIKDCITLGENMPPIETVYNLMVKPYVEKVTAGDGCISIAGSCDCYVLYISEKETLPICSLMKNIPFESTVNAADVDEQCVCDAAAQLSSASYNITMSGEIEVRLCINVSISARKIRTKEFVCDIIQSGEEVEHKRHGMCVYFVKKGDTLWKIAKKYKVPLNTIVSLNKIEKPDLIPVGKPILIPLPCRTHSK